MTLAIWTPKYPKYEGCIRKHYSNEEKWLEKWAGTWSCTRGIKNGAATLERIERLVTRIREEDQSVCLGNAFPKPSKDREAFKRNYEDLENEGTDILYLDFDKNDAGVSLDTDLLARVRICLSKLPNLLNEAGWVAFYSSSAYWHKTDPTRVSMTKFIGGKSNSLIY
jgi:hypothetical protein